MNRKIATFLLFQAGWFAAVLNAAAGRPILGAALTGVGIVLYLLFLATDRKRAFMLVAAAGLLGGAADGLLHLTGELTFVGRPLFFGAPVWIIALWCNFGILLDDALAWLGRRLPLAALLAAAFAPPNYYAGQQLGTGTLTTTGALLVAAEWAVILPLLLLLARRNATTPDENNDA